MKIYMIATLSCALLLLVGCSTKTLDTAQKVAKYNRIASEVVDSCLNSTDEDAGSFAQICVEVKLLATGDAEPDYAKIAAYVVGVIVECLAADESGTGLAEACVEIKAEL
jgi:hypothetical protein